MMKPDKEQVFELVDKVKKVSAEYHELDAQAKRQGYTTQKMSLQMEKAAHTASDLNKQLKAMLVQFTEEERNALREEWNGRGI